MPLGACGLQHEGDLSKRWFWSAGLRDTGVFGYGYCEMSPARTGDEGFQDQEEFRRETSATKGFQT